MAKKETSNYDVIRNQANKDSFRYRDPRSEQDLKRKRREGPASFTPYRVGAIVLGVLLFILSYAMISLISFGVSGVSGFMSGSKDTGSSATGSISSSVQTGTSSRPEGEYSKKPGFEMIPADEAGNSTVNPWDGTSGSYGHSSTEAASSSAQEQQGEKPAKQGLFSGESLGRAFMPGIWNVGLSLLIAGLAFSIIYMKFQRMYEAQNAGQNVGNDHMDDIWLQTVDEMLEHYDYFPDKAGHMSVQPSSIIAHIGAVNRNMKTVKIARRAKEDVRDEDGDIILYKGEILKDDDGNTIYDELPLFDDDFREELFDASGVPRDKELRKPFNLSKIKYNPDGLNRDKLGKYATVADLINADCEIPEYEVGRPGGLYLVDTAPVNTMVLAI